MGKYQLGNKALGFKDAQGNLTGTHRIGNVRYSPGDIVESDDPLDRLFRGKFFPVEDVVPVSSGVVLKRKGRMSLGSDDAAVRVVEGVSGAPSTLDEEMNKLVGTSVAKSPKRKVPEVKIKSSQGKDITDEFPDAELVEVFVFYDDKKERYRVVDVESGGLLRTTKTATMVKKFLKGLLR